MRQSATVLFILFISLLTLINCRSPDLFEHREGMYVDPSYNDYGIPGKFYLGVKDNGTDAENFEIQLKGFYYNNWRSMTPMTSAETTGFPGEYTYYKYEFDDLDESVLTLTYSYQCQYTTYTLFGYQNKTATLGPITFEKPIWFSWKEENASTWNPSFDINSSSNTIIQNEGCFLPADALTGVQRSIESYFSIRNDDENTLYINDQLTKIIDRNTLETIEDDFFIIELLGEHDNRKIELSPNETFNFKLRYVITPAGVGTIEHNVIIQFNFGETLTQFNRVFNIGADLAFSLDQNCPPP